MILEPISPSALRDALNKGKVRFAYLKKDGNLRIALGTTDIKLVPKKKHPKGKRVITQLEHLSRWIPYFDIDKKAWRSVSSIEPTLLHIEHNVYVMGSLETSYLSK